MYLADVYTLKNKVDAAGLSSTLSTLGVYVLLKIRVDAARSMPYVQLNGVSDYIIRVDAAAKMLHSGLLGCV